MLKAKIIKKRREMTVRATLELATGGSLGLFGPSGSGKSTVLACIAGIDEPDQGFVEWGNLKWFPPPLPLHRRSIGYLTQEPGLFPHLTVSENVRFGLKRNGEDPAQEHWVQTLRDRLQLAPLWHAPAARISGGQARRVALARMMARKPPLVLLDEPFAGLDRHLVRELIDDLVIWQQSLGFSMIAVDHQAEVLQRLCPQQVLVLENGEVIQSGTWEELYRTPATAMVRSLTSPL